MQDVYHFKDQHGHKGRLERRDDGGLDMVIDNGDGTATRWSSMRLVGMRLEAPEDGSIRIVQDYDAKAADE